MHRLIDHMRRNLVAWVALFVALGGTGYAAVSLPRNSVGAAQIRNHAIDPVKLDPKAIGGSVRAWAVVSATGKVLASDERPTVQGVGTLPGAYGIRWSHVFPSSCATEATVDERSPGPTETFHVSGGSQPEVVGYASGVVTQLFHVSRGRRESDTFLDTYNYAGQPTPLAFDVVVVC